MLRALIDLLPDERIVYFGDTGRFPYGPKPREEVLAHALEITDVLLGHDVKALVVACNSAAAAALDPLREQLTIPVIGVIEPGLRAAARATRSGRVGDRQRRHHRAGRTSGSPMSRRHHRAHAPRSWVRESVEAGDVDRPGCTCWRSGCWRRSARPTSTRSCSGVRTTRCWPVPSAT